jgi:hypothetical protein
MGLIWHTTVRPSVHASYDNISHLFPLLLIGHVVTYIVLIKGVASERCDFSQFGKCQVCTINWLEKCSILITVLMLYNWPSIVTKGGERCYHTRRGRTDEQWYAIISPYFDERIKMNGPYPEITNISFLAKLFFKTFISLKHLSDYRTVGLSDRLSCLRRSVVALPIMVQ